MLTAKKIIKKVSNVIVKFKAGFCKKIGGPGVIVEVEESKFGKRKYNRGHPVEGVWVEDWL